MPPRKSFVNPTEEGQSKKAHIPRPRRLIAPRVKATGNDHGAGQFTREGRPGISKK